MAAKKLILCVCGAGINTSINAEMTIREYLEKEKANDIEVKHTTIGDIGAYQGRENMVVVWMTAVLESFGAPSVQGLTYLVGSRKAKQELTQQIIALMNSIYKP